MNELSMGQVEKYLMGMVGSLLGLFSGCFGATGCTATLTGGGEVSIGMRNDNFLTLRHTVDGDKEGKQSQSNLELPTIVDWITGEGSDRVLVPLSGDG